MNWASIYKFRRAQLEKFIHGHVTFEGDRAHVVSPFGARSGNNGIQDIDNLRWKPAAVIKGESLQNRQSKSYFAQKL
ncbi:MAG: FAD-dependent monooxygenase [Aestuariivita sp.]|nr:FAD-dependent monooxygenase [Aestuariivita sp.]